MRLRWLEGRREPLVCRLTLLPLVPLAWVYGFAARLDRWLHRVGLRRRVQLPLRVVSVGAIVAGGSGKTPVAAWLAASLHRRGSKVVLASRGYGGRHGSPVEVVSDGRFVRGRAETAGDEPMVLAAHAPGVPVLVGRDRALVGWRALSGFGAEVLVLDDGFQHHRLRRDVDVVVFDGAQGFGNGWVLPRGPLREPARALRRAHAVGVVDGPLPEDDEKRLARLAPDAFRFTAGRRPAALRRLAGAGEEDPVRLAGCAVGILAGLARPAALRSTLEALGARVVAERCFADHHRYRPGDVLGLAELAPLWVTTEKDAVKIPQAWTGGADVRVLSIELVVKESDSLLDWIESLLRSR